MKTLVSQMEAAVGQDEQSKVQIADLKAELAKAEGKIDYYVKIERGSNCCSLLNRQTIGTDILRLKF